MQYASCLQVISSLSPSRLEYWERLWMCSDRRSGPRHPLVYRSTLYLHNLGWCLADTRRVVFSHSGTLRMIYELEVKMYI